MPHIKQDAARKELIEKNGSTLGSLYPNIAYFAASVGWVELGYDIDSHRSSFIIALDPGGMIWEGKDKYASLDEAFRDLEEGLGRWMSEVRKKLGE